MDRMLMQIELTVIAGDHESYRISVKAKMRYMRSQSPKTIDHKYS